MTLKNTSGSSIAIETLLVFLLRASFFFLASRYLQRTLFSDLRQVIHEETSTVAAPGGPLSPSAASGYDTPHSAASYGFAHSPPVSPGAGGNGPSLREQLYSLSTAGRAGANGSSSILPTTAYTGRSPSGTTQRNRANSRGGGASNGSASSSGHTAMTSAKAGGSKGYTSTLAGAIFCLSVSECSSLFALILFGGALSLESRLLNWNLSLGAVLGLIVLVIPFGMCLLLSMRQRATSNSLRRTLVFTSIPFAIYLVILYQLGDYLSSALGVETGSRTFGLFSTTLDRICVPGIGLIAALSGGGAVNTAWEAYEWRERFKSESVVTEGHIIAAQRSLGQTRTDLAARQAELDAVQSSSHDDSRGFVSRMFSTSPHAAKITSLQAEISGLQAMDMQMSRDVQLLRKRKEINELGKTFWGKLMQGLGWGFSAYCVYRVAVSCVNLLFGHTFSSPDGSSGSQARSQPADLASALLVRLATALGWSIDVHTWSKAIGLVLTGSIILVNINAVLGYVSRTFRATSAGVSASFMLLFLSQLMAVYLLTSLISLPHPETSDSGASANSAATLLDTLPDFRVFSRLFDGVFLLAAVGCFVLRWLQRKIRVDEHLGLQDFV